MNQPIENVRVVAKITATFKEVKQILATEGTILLSKRDAQTVFDLLDNPPVPNQQLLAAIEKHRAFVLENYRATEN
jgi:uncharacterized protein (DUF1778 family)